MDSPPSPFFHILLLHRGKPLAQCLAVPALTLGSGLCFFCPCVYFGFRVNLRILTDSWALVYGGCSVFA